jgi:hypothetical protein
MALKTKKIKKVQEVQKNIVIPRPIMNIMKIKIKGLTPYLSDKIQDAALEALIRKTKGLKELKDPKFVDPEVLAFEQGVHWIDRKKQIAGIPTLAFLIAMEEVSTLLPKEGGKKSFSKKLVKAAIKPVGTSKLSPIIRSDKPVVQPDPVKNHNAGGALAIAFRTRFDNWECELTVQYNENLISPQQILTLLDYAGTSYGAGAWRPQNRGVYGQYTVQTK